jgi:hypothetical protein
VFMTLSGFRLELGDGFAYPQIGHRVLSFVSGKTDRVLASFWPWAR